MRDLLKVQYGCGWGPVPDSWINFDASPTLRFERIPIFGRLYTKNESRFANATRYGDIVRGLPIPDGSARYIYCSHVLEHPSPDDCLTALKNTRRVLTEGGVFRMVLPDLESMVNQYLNNSSATAASEFMRATGLGETRRPRGLGGFLARWLGNSAHLWMYDFNSLANYLEEAGFTNIRRAEFNDSAHAEFKEVELYARWENCLGVECSR